MVLRGVSALSRILKGEHRVGAAALGGLPAQELVLTTGAGPYKI